MSTLPKIYRLGDRHTSGILEGHVVIEEKYDGSQFSFGIETEKDGTRKLVCRSKNTELNQADPGMFKQAVETAQRCHSEGVLVVGWQYQCEFIANPRHNVLTYDRVPAGFLVLFDVRDSMGVYSTPGERSNQALLLGLERPQLFEHGAVEPTQQWVNLFLDRTSSLGGCKVEGIVIKNYGRSHDERPGHPQTAKIVSDAFKEVKTKQCTQVGGGGGKAEQAEKIERVMSQFRTEARWCKAVQHIRESGKLTETPKDIAALLVEVWTDTLAEEAETIKSKLLEIFQRDIRCALTKGFPEWYIARLNTGFNQFQEKELMKPE